MAFHSLGWLDGRDRMVHLCAFGQCSRIYGAGHCCGHTLRPYWVCCMARNPQNVTFHDGRASQNYTLRSPAINQWLKPYTVLLRSIDAFTT